MTILFTTTYLPPLFLFEQLQKHKNLIIDQHENYQKHSYRNRCYITGANGKQLMSIPLIKGKQQHTAILDTKINNSENWQYKHWKMLTNTYRRSAFFEYYEEDLYPFYHQKYDLLFEYNHHFFEFILSLFQLKVSINFTSNYIKLNDVSPHLDLRTIILPNKTLKTQHYTQIFSENNGFLENLSIIDFLFCCSGRNFML